MSDNYLRLIALDPAFVPERSAAIEAEAFIRQALPKADAIEAEYYSKPIFIDQGSNLDAVICPRCGKRLDFGIAPDGEALVEWFSDIVARFDETPPENTTVSMACCGAVVPFPELHFDWPAGWASFEISALNPGIVSVPEALVAQIEAILGCKVTCVWAHY